MGKDILVNSEDKLFEVISQLIEESRRQVAKSINTAMVYTYYGVGLQIQNDDQRSAIPTFRLPWTHYVNGMRNLRISKKK